MLRSFILVGLGGALGSMARYGINKIINNHSLHSFPIATFIVNITGCFIIGLLFGIAERHYWMQGNLLLFLATGFCGGFTTFSAFALENVDLINKQHFLTTTLYCVLSLFLGIILCKVGIWLTR